MGNMLGFNAFLEEYKSFNHNVKVSLVFTGLSSFAVGIWGYTVLSGYLKVLTGSNTQVGLAEGIQGALQVIWAFPAGYLADKYRRDRVLKASAIFGQTSVASLLLALFSAQIFGEEFDEKCHLSFILMCIGLALFGAFTGMSNAPLEALYADSTTNETRGRMNQLKFSVMLNTACSGPLTTIILFQFVGNDWTLEELRWVFCIGVVLMIPSNLSLYSFNDDLALSHDHPVEIEPIEETQDADVDLSPLEVPLLETQTPPVESEVKSKEEESRFYWVPRIVVLTDLMAGFSSGMTIKFFPLFFKEESLMTPGEVSLLMFLNYFGISFFSYLARVSSEKIGRVNTMLSFQLPGTFLLMLIYLMSVGYDIKTPGQVPMWRNKILISVVFIVRSSLMNCVRPISRAILMEHIPKENRGKWNAFESLTKFGWSGSAVFGGFLMDKYGYGITFLATALLQFSYSSFSGTLKIFID